MADTQLCRDVLRRGGVGEEQGELVMADTARSQKVIKVFLSNDEQDVVRLSAALRRMSMAEYARTVVVEDARRATAKINFAELQLGQIEGVEFKQQTRAKRSRRRVKLLPRDDSSN